MARRMAATTKNSRMIPGGTIHHLNQANTELLARRGLMHAAPGVAKLVPKEQHAAPDQAPNQQNTAVDGTVPVQDNIHHVLHSTSLIHRRN